MLPSQISQLAEGFIQHYDTDNPAEIKFRGIRNSVLSSWSSRGFQGFQQPAVIQIGTELRGFLEKRGRFIWDKLQEILNVSQIAFYEQLSGDLKAYLAAKLNPSIAAAKRYLEEMRSQANAPSGITTETIRSFENILVGLNAEIDLFAVKSSARKGTSMLPPEIKNLAEQAVDNQIPRYHTATREAIQRTIFEYSNRGILQSSMFDKADCECRIETFIALGENITQAISELHFDPLPHSENDLVSIANGAMVRTMAQEIDNFRMTRSGTQEIHAIALSERCRRVIQETETKIKIHVQSLRHHNQQRSSNTNIIVGDSNVLQTGAGHNANRTTVAEKEKPHWTLTPSFWVAVGVLILTAAILYYTVVLAHNDKQEKPSVPATSTNSPPL